MIEHISYLQAQCTGFMGPRSCSCRDIMRCSVSVMVQAWRAFQGEGKRPSCVLGYILDGIRAVRHAFYENHIREYQSDLCNNFPRIRVVESSIYQTGGGYNTVHRVIIMIYVHNLGNSSQTENSSLP